ncbi:component of SufBCD complex [Anianabacter salinae]|uniref:component of SufBCD complex n=1 Tax=Anianabacter salinae TaxID=2851023 RepID=UPI00225DD816|nr:component of SufBCD complex [Anianabacter salinae]MBV0912134.1 component of SufBCD complex [Anianabacter salinae]
MDIYTTIFEVIDFRSFSNLWYWIALAVLWSTTTHWVLGVPFDLITRARRIGGEAEEDLIAIVRVNVNRILYVGDVLGVYVTAGSCALLAMLAVLGFGYAVEFAQALFLMMFPMSLVGLLSVRTARIIRAEDGAQLYKRLNRHRHAVRAIGMLSIFVTGMWGMYQNLSVGAL